MDVDEITLAKQKRDELLIAKAKFEIQHAEILEEAKRWKKDFDAADAHYESLLNPLITEKKRIAKKTAEKGAEMKRTVWGLVVLSMRAYPCFTNCLDSFVT